MIGVTRVLAVRRSVVRVGRCRRLRRRHGAGRAAIPLPRAQFTDTEADGTDDGFTFDTADVPENNVRVRGRAADRILSGLVVVDTPVRAAAVAGIGIPLQPAEWLARWGIPVLLTDPFVVTAE